MLMCLLLIGTLPLYYTTYLLRDFSPLIYKTLKLQKSSINLREFLRKEFVVNSFGLRYFSTLSYFEIGSFTTPK